MELTTKGTRVLPRPIPLTMPAESSLEKRKHVFIDKQDADRTTKSIHVPGVSCPSCLHLSHQLHNANT